MRCDQELYERRVKHGAGPFIQAATENKYDLRRIEMSLELRSK
jgi:hypothetical protein